jgi:patatin-like phospholipase/acyl hydrolase
MSVSLGVGFMSISPTFLRNCTHQHKNFTALIQLNMERSVRQYSSDRMSTKYRILSIDGGGIRGIIPGKVLEEIEKQTKKPIGQSFDMIAGTSTGGILALGLSLPVSQKDQTPQYTASDVVKFYTDKDLREKIFDKPKLERSLSGSSTLKDLNKNHLISIGYDGGCYITSNFEPIRDKINLKYTAEGIENVLKSKFGETRLSKLLPKEVFVATFNTTTMKHHLWSKKEAELGLSPDVMVWQAARTSSAAPTYFPPYVLHNNEYIDGGVCMNNPTLAAILQAKKLGIPRKNIFCVSIGTGSYISSVAPTTNFGLAHWALNIFDVTCAGISSQVDAYVSALLNKHQYV